MPHRAIETPLMKAKEIDGINKLTVKCEKSMRGKAKLWLESKFSSIPGIQLDIGILLEVATHF